MLSKLTICIFIFFCLVFISKSFSNMVNIPFHDFDEAHRAETAKRMKEYYSFLVPLTGSPQDRSDLRVPLRENSHLSLYYHPERPPFGYWLMIASTSIFGSSEWVYRLPSLVMAIGTILIFVYFARSISIERINLGAIFVGLVALVTSSDLWLSGQYAQLDTSFTFFTFLSTLSLIYYCKVKKLKFLGMSGISAALAVLSKGQPAIILIFPIIFLLLSKKLSWRDFRKLIGFASIILIPWVFLLEIYFGFAKVISIFTEFAVSSAITMNSHINAPFFWYIRWWLDSFRPGWVLFLALLALQVTSRKLDWMKGALLVYILASLLFFSLSVNKIWWYVLPLVPAIAFYIYLSLKDYLDKTKLLNVSLVLISTSLPIFFEVTSKVTILYGFVMTLLSVFILKASIPFKRVNHNFLFLTSIIFSIVIFYSHFPRIVPYHYNTKYIAEYYKNMPGRKCLYIYNMPPETALFYSGAGELFLLTEGQNLLPSCKGYLITAGNTGNLSYQYKDKKYQVMDRKVIFQKDNIKLIPLTPIIDP